MKTKYLSKVLRECLDTSRFVNVFITSACTCKCIMCDFWRKGQSYMLDETFRDVVERLESLGFYNFSLTGGEPLLHPEYFDFVRFLNRKGLYVNSPTNGTLLSEKNVLKLKEAGLDSIFVSIDSLNPKIADYVRQHPGQLNKALKGLKLLKKHGIPRAAILVLSKYNIDYFAKMIVELDEQYDAPSVLCFPDLGVGPLDEIVWDRSENLEQSLMPPVGEDKLIKIIDELLYLKKSGYRLFNAAEYLLDVKRAYLKQHRQIPCYGGYYVLNVDWNGYVAPCFNKQAICHIKDLTKNSLKKTPCFECVNQCFIELSYISECMAKKHFWKVLDSWSTIFKAFH